jgi:hypothetical protein
VRRKNDGLDSAAYMSKVETLIWSFAFHYLKLQRKQTRELKLM